LFNIKFQYQKIFLSARKVEKSCLKFYRNDDVVVKETETSREAVREWRGKAVDGNLMEGLHEVCFLLYSELVQ